MKDKLKTVEIILQRTIRQTCEFMLVLSVILECNSVYRCVLGRPDSLYYLETAALFFGAVLLLALLWEDRKRWEYLFRSSMLLCGIMLFTILFLFFNAIKTGAVANYMLAFLMFLPLMIIIFKIYQGIGEPYRLFYVLSDIVLILAALSLVIWVMAVLLGKLQPTGETTIVWAAERQAKNYFNICFFWQIENLPFIGKGILRNIGIFSEAPMFNIFLNTALMTELFLKERTDWFRCVVISLTVCSTIGTLGVLLMAAGWVMKLFLNIKDSRIKKVFYVTVAVLTIAGIVLIYQKWKVAQGSFTVHIDDYVASIKAWLVHPIIGCGYENESFIQGFMSEFRLWNPGLSNSIAVVLAEGGIVLFLFYLLPFIVFFRQLKSPSGRKTIVPWGIGIFGIYALTIFHYRFYMMMILAFGYSFIILKNGEMHIFNISCCDAMETNVKVQAQQEKKYLDIVVAILCLIIVLISITGIGVDTISVVMDKYRLGLEHSQWRGVFLAMVSIATICLIKNLRRKVNDSF